MRVVLLQDVKGTGQKGSVVEVKDGYARNYLLPRGLARQATAGVVKDLELQRQRADARAERERQQQAENRAALQGQVVEIPAHVGEQGRLFGAVTHADVSQALQALGYEIDRKKIEMEPIKHAGEHAARLHLYPGIEAEITVRVVPG